MKNFGPLNLVMSEFNGYLAHKMIDYLTQLLIKESERLIENSAGNIN